MEAAEALGIVAALANGVHPLTGEVFPAGSPYQHPDVVRALFVAARALEGRSRQLERQRELPENVGKPWTAAQDAQLLADFDSGQALRDIAHTFGRTAGGVQARLEKLGRLPVSANTRFANPARNGAEPPARQNLSASPPNDSDRG